MGASYYCEGWCGMSDAVHGTVQRPCSFLGTDEFKWTACRPVGGGLLCRPDSNQWICHCVPLHNAGNPGPHTYRAAHTPDVRKGPPPIGAASGRAAAPSVPPHPGAAGVHLRAAAPGPGIGLEGHRSLPFPGRAGQLLGRAGVFLPSDMHRPAPEPGRCAVLLHADHRPDRTLHHVL